VQVFDLFSERLSGENGSKTAMFFAEIVSDADTLYVEIVPSSGVYA
jgi:hypothetical protein